MKIKVEKKKTLKKFTFDTLALFEFQTESPNKGKTYSSVFQRIDKTFKGLLTEFIEAEKFEFKSASNLVIKLSSQNKIPTQYKGLNRIILIGMGKKADDKAEPAVINKQVREASAHLIRTAKGLKSKRIFVETELDNIDLLVEAAILVDYDFSKYKTTDDKKTKIEEVYIQTSELSAATKKQIKIVESIATATCLARDLVWEPASEATPSYLAEAAKKIKAENIKVTVKGRAECEKLGMGAFLAVARGSIQEPQFIEITYKPTTKVKKHLALIGKGVTFDSGGLSLKPAKSMEMMKEDMSGAAAIIGIMTAIAEIQPTNVQITAIIAATENMPSGDAYKPGDVITAMNGKTIEVNNTDAEGRLTLADAVTYASGKNPDEIIDFATLTGACMVALGNICAGLMGNDQALIDRIKVSADASGELMWQLPLYEEYKKKLKSPIADLINAGSGGQAGAQNGALFIQEFVGKQKDSDKAIPWTHIDIAGPCWLEKENEWSNKGASGIPVRTILDYILRN